ncbi:MAG: hypothetical protein V4538_01820 [Bacteroidota bacterium]
MKKLVIGASVLGLVYLAFANRNKDTISFFGLNPADNTLSFTVNNSKNITVKKQNFVNGSITIMPNETGLPFLVQVTQGPPNYVFITLLNFDGSTRRAAEQYYEPRVQGVSQ